VKGPCRGDVMMSKTMFTHISVVVRVKRVLVHQLRDPAFTWKSTLSFALETSKSSTVRRTTPTSVPASSDRQIMA